jgi:hypothetical protein
VIFKNQERRNMSRFFIAVIFIIILLFRCANNPQAPANILPTCTITYPNNSSSFYVGDTIIISVLAADNDGFINNVTFSIDANGIGIDNSSPYSYIYSTANLSVGMHSLKAISFDNGGGEVMDEISFYIKAPMLQPNGAYIQDGIPSGSSTEILRFYANGKVEVCTGSNGTAATRQIELETIWGWSMIFGSTGTYALSNGTITFTTTNNTTGTVIDYSGTLKTINRLELTYYNHYSKRSGSETCTFLPVPQW